MRLQRPTIQVVIEGATYHDLNYSLEINLNRIKMESGASYPAYRQTKKLRIIWKSTDYNINFANDKVANH